MQLGDAVASQSVSVVKVCYGNAACSLRELIAAVAPMAAA
jgi:photosystem II oxygen-evolving enhancer protein 3